MKKSWTLAVYLIGALAFVPASPAATPHLNGKSLPSLPTPAVQPPLVAPVPLEPLSQNAPLGILKPDPPAGITPPETPRQVLTQAGAFSQEAIKAKSSEAGAYAAGAVLDQRRKGPTEATPVMALDAAPTLDLSMAGIGHRNNQLYENGRPLEIVGEGSFGVVHAHPLAQVVSKLIRSPWFARDVAAQDEDTGRRLAQAGVGPKVFGVVLVPKIPSQLSRWFWKLMGRAPPVWLHRPVVNKERVYGWNLDDLIAEQKFTQAHYDLVQRMLERMAEARLRVWDLTTSNIRIGTTFDDPQPRAYITDGHRLLAVHESESREDLLDSFKKYRVLYSIGGFETQPAGPTYLNPFDDILKEGLARSRAPQQ